MINLKLSRGEMAYDEAVDMLVKEAGMSKEGAVMEVQGSTLTLGYPPSYFLGKRLILQLRVNIKRRMGKRFSERFCHDVIAANGELPIALLRELFDMKLAEIGISWPSLLVQLCSLTVQHSRFLFQQGRLSRET